VQARYLEQLLEFVPLCVAFRRRARARVRARRRRKRQGWIRRGLAAESLVVTLGGRLLLLAPDVSSRFDAPLGAETHILILVLDSDLFLGVFVVVFGRFLGEMTCDILFADLPRFLRFLT